MTVTKILPRSLVSIGVIVLFALAIGPAAPSAHAQFGGFCSPFIPPDTPQDPALPKLSVDAKVATVVDDEAHGGFLTDEITFTWQPVPANVKLTCIAFGRGIMGKTDYDGVYDGGHDLLAPDATSASVRPPLSGIFGPDTVRPQKACYRFVAVSASGVGPTTEVCAVFSRGRGPIAPRSLDPTPPDTGSGFSSVAGSADRLLTARLWTITAVAAAVVGVAALSGRRKRR